MEDVCLVCSKDTSDSRVNIYSEFPSKNGKIYIHDHISQVVDHEELREACKVSEVLCLTCLKLLLGIDSLQCELKSLKNEFHQCFQCGVEMRKKRNSGSGVWCRVNSARENDQSINPSVKDCPSGSNLYTVPLRNATCGIEVVASILEKNEVLSSDESKELVSQVEISGDIKDSFDVQEKSGTSSKDDKHCRDPLSDIPEHTDETKNSNIQSFYADSQNIVENEPCQEVISNKSFITELPKEADRISDVEISVKTENSYVDDDLLTNFDDHDLDLSKEKDVKKDPVIIRRSVRRKRNSIGYISTQKKKKLKAEEITEMGSETKAQKLPDADEEWAEDSKPNVENTMKSCEICNEKFEDAIQLTKHRGEVHPSVYCYVCKQCTNVRYREKAKLTQHVQRIHKVQVHQCQGCNYEASSQNALDQHIISEHPDSRYFECEICHKAFRTYRYLNFVHIKRCHFGLPIKYTCDKCNKGFVDKSSFENHKLTHSDSKNFTCEFCGSLFHTPYALKVHVNTHTQEKKYNCSDCDTIFLRHCNLIAHRKRFHSSDDVKLVCEVCGKSMATQKDLKRHQIAQHSEIKPFSCQQCSRTYTSKESLKNHLRTHTDEKPYKCDCGKSFHKSSVLRRHQRSVHLADRLVQVTNQDSIQEEMDSVHIGDEDIGGEERMVVITLKECNPPAIYTVRNASSHLEEIMVTNDSSLQSQESTFLSGTLPNTQTIDAIPVLHHQLGTIGTNRIGLATPVLFTTLNTSSPSGTQGQDSIQENLSQTAFATEIAAVPNNMQGNSVSFSEGASAASVKHERIVSFQDETPVTCAPLATQLLQLPPLQTNTSNNPQLTYVTTWPFPDR